MAIEFSHSQRRWLSSCEVNVCCGCVQCDQLPHIVSLRRNAAIDPSAVAIKGVLLVGRSRWTLRYVHRPPNIYTDSCACEVRWLRVIEGRRVDHIYIFRYTALQCVLQALLHSVTARPDTTIAAGQEVSTD